MKKEFDYLKIKDQYYPLIDIEIIGSRDSLMVKALLDSGATFSLFNAEIARNLGISLKSGERLYLQGIKGKIIGYFHRITVKVLKEKFSCNMAFSPEYKASFNILGRNNFFIPFLITFNEKRKKVILKKNTEENK